MSDKSLRYFFSSGALKPSWGKNSLSKKSCNQGKLPVYYSVAPSPISLLCLWCFGLGCGFVNISAVCSGSRQPCMSRILSLTKSRIQWWRISMWLVRAWNCGLCDKITEPSLSLLMTVGPTCGKPSLSYKFLSQKVSLPASESATYSDSVEDIAIIVCFLDFHVIAPSAARKTYPIVDL